MTGSLTLVDDRTVRALENVAAHGDIAPGDRSPRAAIMRQALVRHGLAAYDHSGGRYVVTGLGRKGLSGRNQPFGVVLPFARRGTCIDGI